ncbi:putative motility protein [Bacillus methanolicus]|nr:putative motility protein [Bacillus methanolicus]
MDIAALSMSMHQSKLVQDAGVSVMKIAMDSAKVNAGNLADMLIQTKAMEQSVQSHLGLKIDVRL